jgi:Family of unknown function (DUF6567)
VKIKQIIFLTLTVALVSLLSGCSSTGDFKGGDTSTAVTLKENNYKLVKGAAVGKSYGFKLLGIIPFCSPTYATAKENLYKSAGESLTGKSVALANQTEDHSGLYLILFSIPKLTLTADIVEFTGPSTGNSTGNNP